MKRILVLVTLTLFLCSIASAFQGGGGESPKGPKTNRQQLPLAIRNYLDKSYSGWRLTSVATNCFPDFQRAVVKGDFDGDGKTDYAVKIIRGANGYFLGFLERTRGYEPHVLFSQPAREMASTGMTIARKGEKYSIGDIEDNRYGRLPNDAPIIGACESEVCECIYRNGTFKCC